VLEFSRGLGEICDFSQCPHVRQSTLLFCAPFFLKTPHFKYHEDSFLFSIGKEIIKRYTIEFFENLKNGLLKNQNENV
jgi:hypothetical protein